MAAEAATPRGSCWHGSAGADGRPTARPRPLRPREALTRDHVIPISRGGLNVWQNVVTACSPCNTRKANHMPTEIGMHPLSPPSEPHFVHLSWAVRRLTPVQARYIRVFYGEGTLHDLEELERGRG